MPIADLPDVPDGQPVILSPAVYRRIAAVLSAVANPSVAGAKLFEVSADGRLTLVIDPGGSGPTYGHGLKYQSLMTLDESGTIGWDYPRLH